MGTVLGVVSGCVLGSPAPCADELEQAPWFPLLTIAQILVPVIAGVVSLRRFIAHRQSVASSLAIFVAIGGGAALALQLLKSVATGY